MQILFVTHYFEPNGGAAATRLTQLAHKLQERGHRITVLTTMPHYPQGRIDPAYQRKFSRHETRQGIDVHYVWLWATPSPRISRRLPGQLSFMMTAALRGLTLPCPDVVFIEYQPIFTGLAGRFISRIKRVPYVLNVSDLWPDHLLTTGTLTEQHPVYRAARTIVDGSYRGAAGIMTMSPHWSRKVVEYLGGDDSEKVRTILRGCDLTQFRPIENTTAFRPRYNLGDKKIVSFIGTFATQYDFKTILDVAARLKSRDDTQVVLIGTGSQRNYVEQRLSAGELPNVRLIDWLPHEDMPLAWNASTLTYWAMHDHDLLSGTIPAKFFEALACGTPIAAAHRGEFPAILEHSGGGLCVKPGDVEGLTASIERLLDDDALRRECSLKARAYAVQEFDFETITGRYEAVLQEALQSRR